MQTKKNILSVVKFIALALTIVFYGFIASHYEVSRTHENSDSHSQYTTCCADQALYDAPLRAFNSENSTHPTLVKNTIVRDDLETNAAFAVSLANTSLEQYTRNLNIGFNNTDIIYPFHTFP